MQKFEIEKQVKNNRIVNAIIGCLVVVVALLSIARVILANQLVTTSEKLRTLDKKTAEIELSNEVISEQIRDNQALSGIQDKLQRLGFAPADRFAFITAPKNVALLEETINP